MIAAVADTGPLLHLEEADALQHLPRFAEVIIPSIVERELSRYPLFSKPTWLSTQPLSRSARTKSVAWQEAGLVDEGEADALALALESPCDWFLSDDAAARLLGESLGLEVHGSLGIVIYAAARGLVTPDEARQMLLGLKDSSLWLSSKVFRAAEQALDEIAGKA